MDRAARSSVDLLDPRTVDLVRIGLDRHQSQRHGREQHQPPHGSRPQRRGGRKDVFGLWNGRTRWLARLTGFLLLTGVVFALAFAWINIGNIGGPNDHAEFGSNTDTATATSRHAGTAATDADTAAEDPSSAEPAKEMSQPDTTGRSAVYTGNTQRHENQGRSGTKPRSDDAATTSGSAESTGPLPSPGDKQGTR